MPEVSSRGLSAARISGFLRSGTTAQPGHSKGFGGADKIDFTFYIVQSIFGGGSTAGESWGVRRAHGVFSPKFAAYLSPVHLFLLICLSVFQEEKVHIAFQSALSGDRPNFRGGLTPFTELHISETLAVLRVWKNTSTGTILVHVGSGGSVV